MRNTPLTSLAVLFLVVLLSPNFSQGEVGSNPPMRHPLTDMPGPSDDVATSYLLPQHSDNKIPIGETVTMLCHFANDGKTSLNITAIMASLNNPYEFSFHVQNFTYKPIGVVVKGGEEITLEYQFLVHPMLEPVDFILANTVFYESDDLMYSSTFYNQTVELYTPLNDWDIFTIFQVFSAFLCTALVGVMAFYACVSEKPLPSIQLFSGKKTSDELDNSDKGTEGKGLRHRKAKQMKTK